MMMRTFFLLCARPGLFLGNDDSELFQRERRVLARPVRTNQHRLARLRHHQGASTRPLPVDTGERPLCAPVHTLANGGQHSRLLVARYTMITLTAEYDAGIWVHRPARKSWKSARTPNRRVLSRSFDISLSATHPDNPGHKNQSNVRSKLAAEASDSKGIAHQHSVRVGRHDLPPTW